MGASGWSYYVPYEEDLNAALTRLQQRVFAEGDYWWVHGGFGTSAADYANRPASFEELIADEAVQESGTHSILDMYRVQADGQRPDFAMVQPVSRAEAMARTGVEKLTRDHVAAIDGLADQRWHGRCAVLHDATGQPAEIYFWGFSGD
ncbi:hypothetical protein Cs7R123_09150 [Catellatospora sp. TT07R-123]|uniref:hypothetical protein n=1 Tax=Catellatospora sp. TT07R-123 TaxID=2733863 RepID=UPI001B2514E8|nr:hypothetical protein [Catellatospora sp. TT07R-123]GHJ43573.1 hypothetical protein Cs7R123_09150 [Catellatospora sp. TT07R-123]